MSRPNFLIVIPDQLRADAVGAFGASVAKTPHLDALAARGVHTEGGFLASEELAFESPQPPYDLKGKVQHDHPEAVGRCIAVRDQAWTYVWRMYEACEFYSRIDDPHEEHNLAALPEHADGIAHMHQALLDWLLRTSDVMSMNDVPRFPHIELPQPSARLAAR